MTSSESSKGYEVIGTPYRLPDTDTIPLTPTEVLQFCDDCGLLCCMALAGQGRSLELATADVVGQRSKTFPTPIENCAWHTAETVQAKLAGLAHTLQLLGWPDAAGLLLQLASEKKPDLRVLYAEYYGEDTGVFVPARTTETEEQALVSQLAMVDPGLQGDPVAVALTREVPVGPRLELLQDLLDGCLPHFPLFGEFIGPEKSGHPNQLVLTLNEESAIIKFFPALKQVKLLVVDTIADFTPSRQTPDLWYVCLPAGSQDDLAMLVNAQLFAWTIWSCKGGNHESKLAKALLEIGQEARDDYSTCGDDEFFAELLAAFQTSDSSLLLQTNGKH